MAHLSASIGSCKRAIIFRRRSITLSIFANFPLCGRVISTRRPPLSPGPAGQPGRRVARPHSRRASLIIPSVIVFVSQLVISHSGIIVTCNLPCQPARPLPLYVVRLLALILMSRSSPRSLPPSRSTSLIQTTAAHIFDAIRPPVQSMRCWTDTLFPQDSKSAS